MTTPDETKPSKKKLSKKQKQERRQILRSIAVGGAITGASLLGFFPVEKKWTPRLRPPGALDEREFLAACIKCGQCEQVCPVEAVKLGDLDEGFGVGVAYIDARNQACDFSCDALQCILACPTGALSHALDKPEQVRMGLARLDRPNACLARKGEGFKGITRGPAFQGLLRYEDLDRWNPKKINEHPYDLEICDLCVRECPIKGAISLEKMSDDPDDKRRTPVVHKPCTGCGVCEMVCPVEPACIVVDERRKWESA